MALSFRDYVLITEAIQEIQLEEGWAADKMAQALEFIKKKLGPKATPEKIEAELKKLKGLNAADIAAVKKAAAKKTKQGEAFKERQKKREDDEKAQKGARRTVATVSHHSGVEDAKRNLAAAHASNKLRAGQRKSDERSWMGEETLEEAQDFVVTYKLKTGDTAKRWKVTARDAAQAKRKFGDTHYGAKLVSVEPMNGGKKVPVKKVPEKPSVDEDFDDIDD